MIGGMTRHMLPHLSGVPHLNVNRPQKIAVKQNGSLGPSPKPETQF